MNKFYPVGVVVVVALFVIAVVSGGSRITHFISIASLVLVTVPAAVMALSASSLGEMGRAFKAAFAGTSPSRAELLKAQSFFEAVGRMVIASGIVGFVTGAVVLLANLGGDPTIIGAGTAVALLTVLYAAILDILVPVPFRLAIRRKLAELDG
ncbi:MAG: hypothetical protein ACOC0O_07625 [Spirochaetota bacterium]